MPIELTPLPMTEAQQFWADKVQLGPGEFAKLSAEAKVRAFAVSGIAKGEELNTVFTAMQRAIDQGTTLEQFKEECAGIFERRGWTGKRAWRIDNVFRTNIQTAYNVGQYKQLSEAGDALPIWKYSAINDRRTRPTHRAMDGRAWPANHPIWDTWFPPNGFRCRCSVVGLTEAQARREGIEVEEADPTNTLVEPTDPDTGARMPARQLLPDPGFAHNPGKVYWQGMGEAIADRLEQWQPPVRVQALRDLIEGPVFAHWLAQPEGNFPVGLIDEAAMARTGATVRTVRLPVETAGELADLGAERLGEVLGELAASTDGTLATLVNGRAVRLRIEVRDGRPLVVVD